jgi:hypothetical protein
MSSEFRLAERGSMLYVPSSVVSPSRGRSTIISRFERTLKSLGISFDRRDLARQ